MVTPENYVTRLIEYKDKLKAEEEMYSERASEAHSERASFREKLAITSRELAQSHRLNLEALFPDIALDK